MITLDSILNTSLLDSAQLSFLSSSLERAQALLTEYNSTFVQKSLFGENVDGDSLERIFASWRAGDFSLIPPIEVLPANILQGANGAFSAQTNRIYLSDTLIKTGNIEQIVSVILEEIGHKVDSLVNSTDAPGDEGAIFSAVVRGVQIPPEQLANPKQENDQAIIELEGKSIGIEKSGSTPVLTRVGSEFRVNTTTASDQIYPTVTALNDGGFLVCWQSANQDGNGYGIFAQRYNSAGTPVGSEFKVNTYITSDQSNPTVTALNDGGFLVSWDSYGQDGSNGGIYAQRYNSAGTPVGGEFKINTYTTDDQLYPKVITLNDGGFVVCWQSANQDGNGYGIFAQRYNSAGATVGTEFQVNTYTPAWQYAPDVTALNDGGFLVAWMSDGPDGGGTHEIYAQRYNSAGAKVGGEFHVNT